MSTGNPAFAQNVISVRYEPKILFNNPFCDYRDYPCVYFDTPLKSYNHWKAYIESQGYARLENFRVREDSPYINGTPLYYSADKFLLQNGIWIGPYTIWVVQGTVFCPPGRGTRLRA